MFFFDTMSDFNVPGSRPKKTRWNFGNRPQVTLKWPFPLRDLKLCDLKLWKLTVSSPPLPSGIAFRYVARCPWGRTFRKSIRSELYCSLFILSSATTSSYVTRRPHTCHNLPPSEIDGGLFLADFAGSEGIYLFHRIGWKGRIWQPCIRNNCKLLY